MATQEMLGHETSTGLLGPNSAHRQLDHHLQLSKSSKTRVGVVHVTITVPGLHSGIEQADLDDQVMRLLAYRLTSAIRATDPSAQMGTREFLVLLPGLTQPEDALRVAEGVVRALRHPLSVSNRVLQPGVNAGVAVSGAHGTSPEKLMEVAKESVSEARKRPGKGAYMGQWKLAARMLGSLNRKAHAEITISRRRTDSRDWTGPRSER